MLGENWTEMQTAVLGTSCWVLGTAVAVLIEATYEAFRGSVCQSRYRVRSTHYGCGTCGPHKLMSASPLGQAAQFSHWSGTDVPELPSVQPLSLRFRLPLAALLCAMPIRLAHAQSGAASAARPAVGLHDSINVASLDFAGAHAVSPAELKRGLHADVELPARAPRGAVQGVAKSALHRPPAHHVGGAR